MLLCVGLVTWFITHVEFGTFIIKFQVFADGKCHTFKFLRIQDTPFENPLVTFVTMISFAISTPDISIFRLANDDTREESIPYPVLSFIIWIIFGVIMSVLFLNFLVGYTIITAVVTMTVLVYYCMVVGWSSCG